jgi:hypothetical protein
MAHHRAVNNCAGIFDINQLGRQKDIANDGMGDILDAIPIGSRCSMFNSRDYSLTLCKVPFEYCKETPNHS